MSENNGSTAAWFLAGLVVGAAGALLYAPQSGKDTRTYLGKTTQSGREAMEASGEELMERGKELYERGKKIADEATELFERGKKLVQG